MIFCLSFVVLSSQLILVVQQVSETAIILYIHCCSGYRGVIAASLMKCQGIHNLRNVVGGWDKIRDLEKVEIEKSVAVLN